MFTQKMVVAGLAAALLTEMRHALCGSLAFPCSHPHHRGRHGSCEAGSRPQPRLKHPRAPPVPRYQSAHSHHCFSAFASCSSPTHPHPDPLSPSWYSPDRPGLGGYGASPQAGVFCVHSPVSAPLPPIFAGLPRDWLWKWAPLSRTSLSFLCPPSRLWLLGCAWQETSPGGRVCQPGSPAGGLERKLAPPHGLSPLPHPCRLAGGQAASRFPALSSQPSPA